MISTRKKCSVCGTTRVVKASRYRVLSVAPARRRGLLEVVRWLLQIRPTPDWNMPNFGEMDSNVLEVQRTHKPSGGIDIFSNSQRARLLGVDCVTCVQPTSGLFP